MYRSTPPLEEPSHGIENVQVDFGVNNPPDLVVKEFCSSREEDVQVGNEIDEPPDLGVEGSPGEVTGESDAVQSCFPDRKDHPEIATTGL